MEESIIALAPPEVMRTCMAIIKTLHDVRPRLKPAPLTMTSITTECFGIHELLTQVQELDTDMNAFKQSRPQLVHSIEGFLRGCGMTVSVIDEYTMELHKAVVSSTLEEKASLRQLWKEDDMKELLSQIREYRVRFIGLLEMIESWVQLLPF
jgi:uncharacterized protein YoxC